MNVSETKKLQTHVKDVKNTNKSKDKEIHNLNKTLVNAHDTIKTCQA